MAEWAVANLTRWPVTLHDSDADPADIDCEFIWDPELSTLPVLTCKRISWTVDAWVWFYAKRREAALAKRAAAK